MQTLKGQAKTYLNYFYLGKSNVAFATLICEITSMVDPLKIQSDKNVIFGLFNMFFSDDI